MMTESKETAQKFLGTYFDRDAVHRVARVADIFSWIVAVVYGGQLVLSVGILFLQIARGNMIGLGFTDYAQQFLWAVESPFRGVLYFVILQAVGKALLILLDMEENTRRSARK
jgi:hypothetical protein